jgi:hypothetical protein
MSGYTAPMIRLHRADSVVGDRTSVISIATKLARFIINATEPEWYRTGPISN